MTPDRTRLDALRDEIGRGRRLRVVFFTHAAQRSGAETALSKLVLSLDPDDFDTTLLAATLTAQAEVPPRRATTRATADTQLPESAS